jgi:hypothetical protein
MTLGLDVGLELGVKDALFVQQLVLNVAQQMACHRALE